MRLTPHFTYAEFITTKQPGLQGTPSDEELSNGVVLAASVLEPWRVRVGPLRVNSWYRSPTLNDAVGGVKTSHHLKGYAADVVPMRMSKDKAWGILLEMIEAGLPVTEAIYYTNKTHIHVSYAWTRVITSAKVLVR